MQLNHNMRPTAKVIALLCLVTNGIHGILGAPNFDSKDNKPESSLIASKECILLNKSPEIEVYKLKIHGDTIKFSDISDNACQGIIRHFELFALDEIIVDKDFIKNGEVVQVVAVAPKLKIIGNITINLNGSNAQDYIIKAEDGKFGISGNPGLAGLPGGPGGIFYAFANDIENGDSLTISANGGSGGRGQDGGNGGNGLDGTPPDVKELPQIIGFDNNLSNCKAPRNVCNYTGTDGHPGGNGGDGGMAGKGGKGGIIFLHQLNENSKKINQYFVSDGQKGLKGKGGKGGQGGKNGGYVEIPCCGKNRTGFQPPKDSKIQWGSKFAPSGKDGIDGASSKNQEEPEQFLGFSEFSLVVHDYKKFLRSHWNDESRKERLTEFYNKVVNSPEIKNKCGPLCLLEELKGLEDQSLNFMKYLEEEIHEHRNLKGQINNNKEEASNFINIEIKTEIDEIGEDLKDKVYQLINATMILKDVAAKRKEVLENEVNGHYLTSMIKMGVTGASVLVPGGQLLAPAALAAVQAGKSFSEPNEIKPPELKVPKAVEKVYEEALKLNSAYTKNELELVDKTVDFLNQEKEKQPSKDIISNIPDQVSNVFNIFKSKKKNENIPPNTDEPKKSEGLFGSDIFNKLKIPSNPFNLSMDTFIPAGDEKDKIKKLRDDIGKVNDDIEHLRVYQDEIFTTLIPLLQRMKKDLPTEKELSLQSAAALDISKWRVKTSVKKVRRVLKKFTEGFEVADDMSLLMERLDDSIGTLMDIYGRIKSYNQEEKLVAYITSTVINSTLYLIKMKNENRIL